MGPGQDYEVDGNYATGGMPGWSTKLFLLSFPFLAKRPVNSRKGNLKSYDRLCSRKNFARRNFPIIRSRPSRWMLRPEIGHKYFL